MSKKGKTSGLVVELKKEVKQLLKRIHLNRQDIGCTKTLSQVASDLLTEAIYKELK